MADAGSGKMTILIVDDEQAILDFVEAVLEDAGYDVVTAPDGRAALRMVHQRMPSLVLTDLMMPLMDGQALCSSLRAEPMTAELPILLMTAAYHPPIYAEFNAIIDKPFGIDELLEHVLSYTH